MADPFASMSVVVTIAGFAMTWVLVFRLLYARDHGGRESVVAAVALMFSSTILVVILLPTKTLHQQRMGSICIAS